MKTPLSPTWWGGDGDIEAAVCNQEDPNVLFYA